MPLGTRITRTADLTRPRREQPANGRDARYCEAIVHCAVDLATAMGVEITAEGIETVEQLQLLRSLGCEIGQGFLFGAPLRATDVLGFIAAWETGRIDTGLPIAA